MRRAAALCFCLLAMLPGPPCAAEAPYREDSGLSKTEVLLAAGRYNAAIDTANDVLSRHADNADAYTYRAYAHHALGEDGPALKDLRRALKLRPNHLGANKYLGDMYLESGDVARAREQLQVIRMVCGAMDCEELRVLQGEIDRFGAGERPEKLSPPVPEEEKMPAAPPAARPQAGYN